ncbi:MAG: DUF3788 family protein [Paludibacter sp.]|jgi:hypothetical protein|nr:DUF3788 family protein [Paludibacter sp.]
MSQQLLRDPEISPSDAVLKNEFGNSLFEVYQALLQNISTLGLQVEWRYYRDGKAWLCKITRKAKTVCWLSPWEGYLQIGFYFTEKDRTEIMALDIDNTIKTEFESAKSIGKLIPLIMRIDSADQLRDWNNIAVYKK